MKALETKYHGYMGVNDGVLMVLAAPRTQEREENMIREIKRWDNNAVLWSGNAKSIKEAAERAVEAAKDRQDNTREEDPRLRRKIHVSPKKAVLAVNPEEL